MHINKLLLFSALALTTVLLAAPANAQTTVLLAGIMGIFAVEPAQTQSSLLVAL